MEEYKLINILTALSEDVSKGNYRDANRIFELTDSQRFPEGISRLAEAFGMMIVQLEAREQRLEGLIEDLRKSNKQLEAVSKDLFNANIGMLETLGNAIAKRDSDTSSHNYRVAIYSIRIGELLRLDKESMRGLIKGAFLHDLGKIAISDKILLKPGKLTEDEFEIMKTHVSHGADLVRNYSWLSDALPVVLYHHERFNGSGYLIGLGGDRIPLNARIFSAADVFDALTSVRPYKKAFSFEESINLLKRGSGSHFDPQIINCFSTVARRLYEQVCKSEIDTLKADLKGFMDYYFSASLIADVS